MSADSERQARLRGLELHLRTRICGQDHLIPRVASALTRGDMGLVGQDRPRAAFLFVGPTGTGKTELATCFTEYLFGRGRLHRFDLSEYQSASGVERLIGGSREDGG